jgi:hypothetical protein
LAVFLIIIDQYLQAAATLGTKANTDSLSFRLLLSRDHSSDRKLEDRSAAATNPTLTAVKRLEVRAQPLAQ